MKTRILLLLALASSGLAQSPGTFTGTGDMTAARYFHTATLLTNGKVLIAGGVGVGPGSRALASAELYDPATRTFSATVSMATARNMHTATLLPDGRVLIAGGRNEQNSIGLISAELYDPSTGNFTATGNMTAPGSGWTPSLLLSSGTVLVKTDGFGAQLYDPATGTFAATDLCCGRPGQGYISTANLLADGRVLITGYGSTSTGSALRSELYNPATGAFSPTDPHNDDLQTATLLTTGKVLFEGGDDDADGTAELYNPADGTFSATGRTVVPRRFTGTATLLPDGTVLLTGGDIGGASLAASEIYDPALGTFSATGSMMIPRQEQTATLLPDGTVLIAGGSSPSFVNPTSSAEIYTPLVLKAAPMLFSLSGDGRGQGAILHAATQQLVSPVNPAVAGEALEIYCTGLIDGSVIPPQVAIGGRMADVLFFGNAPGFVGLNQVNVRVPSGVAPGPSIPVRLTYLGRTSNEVTIGVR